MSVSCPAKLNHDGTLAHLEAHLVVKGYSQTYDVDYMGTFSPAIKIVSVYLLILIVATHHWTLDQLKVKNIFLQSILAEEV